MVFSSKATNLVPGDNNQEDDVFVHDRMTGVIERISVASNGAEGNGICFHASISGNGRYVVFESESTNLVPGDTNGVQDLFLRDLYTGTTTRVSVATGGGESNGWSGVSSISPDCRYIAFKSEASNLVPGDTNGVLDIFLHDRSTGGTERISVNSNGIEGNGDSERPSISADGRYVAFFSYASNLVLGDRRGDSDVFVRDRLLGRTKIISVNSNGYYGNGGSKAPSISADGRYVAFRSNAFNLVYGDTNDSVDIFVRDRLLALTTRVSVTSSGVEGNWSSMRPVLSADGRFVAFKSKASNLVPGDTNGVFDVFVHDRENGTTERISTSTAGVQGNGRSLRPGLSADGRYVIFWSEASTLVAGDTNNAWDAFLHDRGSGSFTNTILLTGPFEADQGTSMELNWYAAPPGSAYWLAWSPNLNGSVMNGHLLGIGNPLTLLSHGWNSPQGSGSAITAPIPASAVGRTIYCEVAAQDTAGTYFDSNALATFVR